MRISDWSSDVCSSDLEKIGDRSARDGTITATAYPLPSWNRQAEFDDWLRQQRSNLGGRCGSRIKLDALLGAGEQRNMRCFSRQCASRRAKPWMLIDRKSTRLNSSH